MGIVFTITALSTQPDYFSVDRSDLFILYQRTTTTTTTPSLILFLCSFFTGSPMQTKPQGEMGAAGISCSGEKKAVHFLPPPHNRTILDMGVYGHGEQGGSTKGMVTSPCPWHRFEPIMTLNKSHRWVQLACWKKCTFPSIYGIGGRRYEPRLSQ